MLDAAELAELNELLARTPVTARLVDGGEGRYALDMRAVADDPDRELAGSFASLLRRAPDRLKRCDECAASSSTRPAAGRSAGARRSAAIAHASARTVHAFRNDLEYVRPRHDPRLQLEASRALLRDRAERARDRADAQRRALRRVGRLLARGGRRGEPGHPAAARRLRRAVAGARRRVLAVGHGGRLRERRRARPAAAVQRRLLRRLPARPGREQHRGRPPRLAPERRQRRPPLDPRLRRRGGDAVLRERSGRRRASASAASSPTGRTSRASAAPSRSSRRRSRRRTSTSRSPRRTTRRSTASTATRPRPATATTALPASAPIYHEGYYAAFVLDPDGNNVEVVNHNR